MMKKKMNIRKSLKIKELIDKKPTITFILFVAFSVLLLLIGNQIATRNFNYSESRYDYYRTDTPYFTGRITAIYLHNHLLDEPSLSFMHMLDNIVFEITNGPRRGHEISLSAHQIDLDDLFMFNELPPQVGDSVILRHNVVFGGFVTFYEYNRTHYLSFLFVLLVIIILIYGKLRGMNILISLAFTYMSVFFMLIPAIFSGYNIYVAVILMAIYVVFTTILIILGFNKKAYATIIICIIGLFFSYILTALLLQFLNFTTFIDGSIREMIRINRGEWDLNLNGILFAAIIIGCLGALMDTSITVSSALWELKVKGNINDIKSFIRSGINIGKDTFGTQVNNLVLAYIGSSFPLFVAMYFVSVEMGAILSLEIVIFEIIRALIGAFILLVCIPISAFVCGYLYKE
ncbi:MAG: YibE/F family protein [Defluviitaleaceae bacterium]|nr:YibE/F family protein [Defluviitaleaceae bacterium]